MDLQPIRNQEATSSSSASSNLLPTHQLNQESSVEASTPFAESRALRSSARVKAAKQKEQEKDKGKYLDFTLQASSALLPFDSVSTRATRPSPASRPKRVRD